MCPCHFHYDSSRDCTCRCDSHASRRQDAQIRAATKSATSTTYHLHPATPPRGEFYNGVVALRIGSPTELTILLDTTGTPAERADWLDALAEQATKLAAQVRQAEAFATYPEAVA